MMLLLLLVGCLERVTGEPVPLDPRFYAAVEAAQGKPGEGGGTAIPFSDYTGETITVRGTVRAPEDLDSAGIGVDLDVRVPDPTAEGGVDAKGKLLLDGPGPFELTVPKDLGKLELQAFQDIEADGPSGEDPFASVWLEVGAEDLEGVELDMVAGAGGMGGGGGPVHVEAPPGAPGGAPHAGGGTGTPPAPPPGGGEAPPHDPNAQGTPEAVPPPGGGGMEPFVGYSGPMVTLSGTLTCESCPSIDLDLFQPTTASNQQRRQPLGKLKLAPGPYSVQVPRDFGPLVLEAFYDANGNGPGMGDLMGRYPGNPLQVGRSDVSGVDITLELNETGMMPGDAPRPPPPPGGSGI